MKQRASTFDPLSSALLAVSVADVPWIAGVSDASGFGTSGGENSAVDCAIHGTPATIVGLSCLTLGSRARANWRVGPNDAWIGPSALSTARSVGGSSAIVSDRSCWRAGSAPLLLLNEGIRWAGWAWGGASPLIVWSTPTTTPERSFGCWPSSASLTIEEAWKAL